MKEADHGAGSRTNTARRRRRNIFDFSDKERKEMLKEVARAMKDVKGPAVLPGTVDRSNLVYWLVAIFSMTVFWILPWVYRKYIIPILFASEIGEFIEFFK